VRLYLVRRLAGIVPVWIAIAMVVFAMLRFIPGDPALVLLGSEATAEQLEAVRVQLGLTKPVPIQFVEWLGHVVRGDLGESLSTHRPVMREILERLPRSLELATLATLISLLVALPSGVLAAVRRNTPWDQGFLSLGLVAVCIPSFVLALLLILVFSVQLGWFPLRGYRPMSAGLGTWLKYMILPATAYGLVDAAQLSRMTRSTMIDVLGLDFVRTARAKGLAERRVIYRHALENAMLPIVTIVGLNFGVLFASTVVIEYVFGLPGIGSLLVDAIRNRDYPVVQGVMLTIATMYTLLNIVVDVSYAWLDPRIRYE
jgi:peptide/nickel transport system permease protein